MAKYYLCIIKTMAKILHYIFISVTLSIFLVSCGGDAVHSKLALADTLMWTNPDSSLRVLKGIDTSTLVSEAGRAYYALLLTQANYRCDIKASETSQAMMYKALTHYSCHGHKEMLTRAYLYSGTVQEELGHLPEAMRFYKLAELNAETRDFRNLGQIYLRIGDLYFYHYANNGADVANYKKSLSCYEKIDDLRHQMNCLTRLAAISRLNDGSYALKCIHRLMAIGRQLADSTIVADAYEFLSGYYIDSSPQKAKEAALYGVKLYGQDGATDYLYYDLVRSYARLRQTDSAKYYFGLTKPCAYGSSTFVLRNSAQREIYLSANDYKSASAVYLKTESVTDSLLSNKMLFKLMQAESNAQQEFISDREKSTIKIWLVAGVLSVMLLAIISIAIRYQLKLRRREAIISSLRKEAFNSHESLLLQMKEERRLRTTIQQQIEAIHRLISVCQHGTPEQFAKCFNEIVCLKSDKISGHTFWADLRHFINNTHNSVIDRLRASSPGLSEDEMHIIELVCCGFSYTEIALCMSYTPSYAAVKKTRIAKKMHLQCTLDEYVKKLIAHDEAPAEVK